MKTKLHALPDWRKTLEKLGWEDAPTGEDVDQAIQRELTRGKVTFVEQPQGLPIEKGCRVTLKTESVLPKFNREKTVVTVGSGLYDPTVEEKLCGMLAGDRAQVTVKGEQVSFTVQKVEQKHVPPLTDDLVKELDLEGVEDLPAYHQWMENKLRGEYARKLVKRLAESLASKAQMDQPDRVDVRQVIDLEYEPLRARFSLDTMSPEQWEHEFGRIDLQAYYAQIYPDVAKIFGTTSKESYYQSRQKAAEETIRECLVMGSILKEEADPTKDAGALETLQTKLADQVLAIIYGG